MITASAMKICVLFMGISICKPAAYERFSPIKPIGSNRFRFFLVGAFGCVSDNGPQTRKPKSGRNKMKKDLSPVLRGIPAHCGLQKAEGALPLEMDWIVSSLQWDMPKSN